eukprot:7235757-Pyramimonas_sp.AAC.1
MLSGALLSALTSSCALNGHVGRFHVRRMGWVLRAGGLYCSLLMGLCRGNNPQKRPQPHVCLMPTWPPAGAKEWGGGAKTA